MSGNRGVNTGVIIVDTPLVATEIPKPAPKRFGLVGKRAKGCLKSLLLVASRLNFSKY